MTPADEPAPRLQVSVLDMTIGQVEALERELGLPVTRWREAASQAQLLSAIYAAATGQDRATIAERLTLRELIDLVDLTGGDPAKT